MTEKAVNLPTRFEPRPRPYVLVITYVDGPATTLYFLTDSMRTSYMRECIEFPRVVALKRYDLPIPA